MKKQFLLFAIIVFLGLNATATHFVGADLTYRLIDTLNGKYRFTLSLYRDCSGIDYSSSESLTIRTMTVNTTLPMNLVSKMDVTNVCRPPDVSSPVVTNCPSGAIGLHKGIEKWTYTIDYIVGKNIGWAFAGWGSCCRNTIISTIQNPGSQGAWIQSVFNTDYQNSSPVFDTMPIPYWCRLRNSVYANGTNQIYDSKFININGKSVLLDSISYKLYTPFTGVSSNINSAISMGNPSVIYNTPLNANNFLYTTSGVTFDPKTGQISAIASITQDAIIAMAVMEYRAVPDNSPAGYSRVFVGYTTRDIQFTVRDICDPINVQGVISDSLFNADYISSSATEMTSDRKNIKIVFKATGPSIQNVKMKQIKSPDINIFKGYRFNYTKKTGTTTDTLFGVIEIDSLTIPTEDFFVAELYYCSTNGTKFSNNYLLKLNVKQALCNSIGDSSIATNLNISKVKIQGGVNSLDNQSACNSLVGTQGVATGVAGRYANYVISSTPKTKVIKGSQIVVFVNTLGCISGSHPHTKALFIDWNGNYNFLDPGERYNISNPPFNTPNESVTITVPANANLGRKIMRVVARIDTPTLNLMPCGKTLNASNNQGETEDYEIEVIEDFRNCTVYKNINYIKNGSQFNFTSSGLDSIPSPYVVRYNWTFSNGQSSTQKNPSISFPNWKYNWAKLVVCIDSANVNVCCDSSRLDSIGNCKLTCNIIKSGDTLTNHAINGIPPYTYFWSNGSTTQRIITSAGGNYIGFITDSTGCATECQFTQTGSTNLCSYYRNFTWTNIGSNHTFTSSPSIPNSLNPTYHWTFSNGQTSTLANPIVSLNPNSSYTVKMVYCLRDSSMNVICCDSVTKLVQTTGGNSGGGLPCNLKANFNWTTSSNGSIQFIDSTTPQTSQMYTYLWTFGDGTFSTNRYPSKIYFSNGPKQVCLLVKRWLNNNNMFCQDTICKTVNVTNVVPCNRLMPNFSFNVNSANPTVHFYNMTNLQNFNLISISYLIHSSNTIYNSSNPSHTFTTGGTHLITMTISAFDILSGTTCTKSITKSIYINGCGCFDAYNNYTKSGMTVNFINNSFCVDTNTTYLYKFGNGDTSNSPNPSYTYTLPGMYRTVMYIQRTVNGITCKDSFIRIIEINSSNMCKDSGYQINFPYFCSDYISPVCGCDSITYKNFCYARKAGVKQYSFGICPNDTQYVKICGYVYEDKNKNCAYDTSDNVIPYISIKINTSPYQYATTNAYGYYSFYAIKGIYQLTQNLSNQFPPINQNCPASNATITVSATTGGVTYCNNNFYDTVNTCPDLEVKIHRVSNITPGFPSTKRITYRNRGAIPISGVVLKYRFLSGLTVNYVSNPSYSLSGNVFTWNLGTLAAYSTNVISVRLNTPVTMPLGTAVVDSVWIEPTAGDCLSSNNVATYNDTCVGSWDPNDKAAYPANNIDTSVKWIDYLVRFQNTGTAPAHDVKIEDAIDANFDKSSLRIINQSHTMNHYFNDEGKVFFEFPNIMLPDSGTDYEASQGYVSYSIRLKDRLPAGTQLKNTAHIFFDFNEAVITNTTVNTIVLKSGSAVRTNIGAHEISLYPNPSKYQATLDFTTNKNEEVSYVLYDLQGKKILSKELGNIPSGSHNQDIELDSISNGIYILNVKIGDKETSIKLVKE